MIAAKRSGEGSAASSETPSPEIVLVRHAETEWSLEGRHTGRTDVPLTTHGRGVARALSSPLRQWSFELVLSSPARRALETCELSGLGARMHARDELREWDYGEYEGLTTAQIQALRPGWVLWRDGCPGGENAAQVGARADRVLAELHEQSGNVAIFSHAHMLRVLAARWIELDPAEGDRLALSTGSISVLGYERDTAVLCRWNTAPGGVA
jgi:broad specificity phosphatase PhoE